MYLPFVMLGYGGVLCTVLAGCWLVGRSVRDLRGVRELGWAVGAAIASVALVGLRPWAPAFLSILLGNCFLFAYFLLVYRATAQVLKERGRAQPWLIGLCVAALVPFSFYAFIRPDIVARIVIGGGAAAIVGSATAVLLLRQGDSGLEPAAAILGWVQLLSAALYVGRSIVSVRYPPVHFVSGDWIQTLFTYGQMLARLGSCCGVLWLALCANRRELETLATSDGLTGLLNRRAFDEILSREMFRCHFRGASVALILVDIDRFKDVNDTYGHGEGDAVLRQMGETLRKGIRPSDALARYGGEEFAILLEDGGSDRVIEVAERLRAEIEQTEVGPKKIRVTASLGVAESCPSESPAEFLHRCDRALYQSKDQGRNGVSLSTLRGVKESGRGKAEAEFSAELTAPGVRSLR